MAKTIPAKTKIENPIQADALFNGISPDVWENNPVWVLIVPLIYGALDEMPIHSYKDLATLTEMDSIKRLIIARDWTPSPHVRLGQHNICLNPKLNLNQNVLSVISRLSGATLEENREARRILLEFFDSAREHDSVRSMLDLFKRHEQVRVLRTLDTEIADDRSVLLRTAAAMNVQLEEETRDLQTRLRILIALETSSTGLVHGRFEFHVPADNGHSCKFAGPGEHEEGRNGRACKHCGPRHPKSTLEAVEKERRQLEAQFNCSIPLRMFVFT